MYVSVKIYVVASQSYLEVVDPDCGSVIIMKRNREDNEVSQKYTSDKGDAANRWRTSMHETLFSASSLEALLY